MPAAWMYVYVHGERSGKWRWWGGDEVVQRERVRVTGWYY